MGKYSPFHFKKFSLHQAGVAHPCGSDSMLLGGWPALHNTRRILDIGTGTGVVALLLAQRSEASGSVITALDIHPPSVDCARSNFENSPWRKRLQAVVESVQDFAGASAESFDLIVSNPPFFSETVISPDRERQLGRHTATLRIEQLLAAVQRLLAPDGRFCVILPPLAGQRLCELAACSGLYCTRRMQVQGRVEKPVERLLLQLERSPYQFEQETLCMYQAPGVYTPAYRALTQDFFLLR